MWYIKTISKQNIRISDFNICKIIVHLILQLGLIKDNKDLVVNSHTI